MELIEYAALENMALRAKVRELQDALDDACAQLVDYQVRELRRDPRHDMLPSDPAQRAAALQAFAQAQADGDVGGED